MRTALDTNVLSELLSQQAAASRVSAKLADCKDDGPLVICAVVYAELLAHPKVTEEFLAYLLFKTGIEVDFKLDESVWTEAGRRFARHASRRRMATSHGPRRILADFLIGAHALRACDRLMTFDTKVFETDFPEVRLYTEHLA